jgi:hypothetical protein
VLCLGSRGADRADQLGGLLALRAQQAARLGARCSDHAVRHAVHVRGRLHAEQERPRTRRRALRLLPAAHAGYANESLAIREQTFNADPIPVYPFKFVIPLAGGILLLQGLVEIVRCVLCLRHGEWPSREEDVEEVDVDKLKEMVHVKDADIEALDTLLPAAQRQEGA